MEVFSSDYYKDIFEERKFVPLLFIGYLEDLIFPFLSNAIIYILYSCLLLKLNCFLNLFKCIFVEVKVIHRTRFKINV